MADRILHIGHRFSKEYDRELLHRAAEVAVAKGPAALVTHLIDVERLEPAAAQTLAQKINAELLKVNRGVLLQYVAILSIFLVLVIAGLTSGSYIFAGVFALPALLLLYSMIKFLKRHRLQ